MGNCCKKRKSDIYISNKIPLKTKDEKMISQNDFEKIKIIGSGSFGNVYLVKNKRNNNYYAMKILEKSLIKKTTRRSYNIRKNFNGKTK